MLNLADSPVVGSDGVASSDRLSNFTPIPGLTSSIPTAKTSSTLTPLVCDERAVTKLLWLILSKGGLSVREISRRLGVTPQSVRTYLADQGKRKASSPGLLWFVKFADAAGAKVTIEFPEKQGR